MFDTQTSGNDPLFFFHHSFVDFIWEMWRQSHQVGAGQNSRTAVGIEPASCRS